MTAGEKTRALKEWALFTSLAVMIGLAGIYLPFLALCFPIPVIILVIKLDSRYGMLGLAMAGLVIAIAVPFLEVLVLIIQYGLLGILYGLLFKNSVSSGRSLLTGTAFSVVLAFLSIWLVYLTTGQNFFITYGQLLEQMLATGAYPGGFGGVPPEWEGVFAESAIKLFEQLLPGQVAVGAAMSAALTYLLARAVLRQLQIALAPALEFTMMRYPWYSIWGLISGLGLVLAGDTFSLGIAAAAGKNILFIFFFVYFILGLSVAGFFYKRTRMAKPLKILFWILVLISLPYTISFVLLLGVADPLVNFRRFQGAN